MEFTNIITLLLLLGIYTRVECACDKQLGISYNAPDDIFIPNEQISASSSAPYTLADYGRLHYPTGLKVFGVWCAAEDDNQPWFQVNFKRMAAITKVAIGTNDFVDAYVTTFIIKYSYNEKFWYDVTGDDWSKAKVFNGMKNLYDIVTVDIGKPVVAQYFRIYPLTKRETFCLQTEFYGCYPGKDCNKAIGIENDQLFLNKYFTSSSSYLNHKPSDARLNNVLVDPTKSWGAWCASDIDLKPWLQIDLKMVREISRIATQGHPYTGMNAWVKEYKLNYSLNAIEWSQYNKVFQGNINSKKGHANDLIIPVIARYIRFIPITWNELPCLRVEAYECTSRKEFIPKVETALEDATINRGEEFSLKCEFTGQPGIELAWHLNKEFLSTTDRRISTQQYKNNRTVTALLRFKRIKSEEDGAMFTCLAWYPNLQTVHASSAAIITVKAPIPSVTIVNITATSTMFEIDFTGPLTKDIDGYKLRIKSLGKNDRMVTLSFKNTTYFNYLSLLPYRNYTVEVAMLYIENEVGKFYSRKNFETIQDVPYGEPMNLKVTKTSHDTLHASWNLPKEDLRNGPITHYEVRYLKSVKENEKATKVNYRLVNGTGASLYGLDAGSNYEISVRAFTIIGPGPFNHPPTLIFTGAATEELNSIREMHITEGNAAAVGVRLQNITADPNFLNKHDVVLTIDILEKVVEAQNSSEMIGESLVSAVSNVLKANKTVLAESEITNRTGTRYVKMLEKWLENVSPAEKELEENSENVMVKKIFLNKYEIEEGIKFAEADGNEILIPSEALPKNASDDQIYFVYYKTNKFFTEKKKIEERCENGFTVLKERVFTPVISGEIVGKKTKNLSAPVILKFKANEKMDLTESACVYWDFSADGEKGGWSTDGCELESIVNRTITCHCTHLTNFAAMMDIFAQTSKVCGYHKKIITYISIIGSFLSLIGLFLTFLTYLLFRRLLKEMAAKVLIQLCGALFIVIVAFVTGIEQTDRPYVCTSVAVIIHYFTLVAFMWMLMEAAFMYHAFVRVWPPRESGDIIRSTVVAWGIPLFIVLVTFLTNVDKYGGQHYCHVTGIPFYVGYLAPIGLIILTNLTIFIFIMYRLSSRPNSNTDQSNIEIALIRLKRAFGIMILMGLTWAFGFGSASSARLEFNYLFAICNGLQGFAIFMFYCLAQKNARMAWYRFFTCDTRSERKITSDSYYERRRLSSATSNRTNTLQFTRGGSNASLLQFNSPPSKQNSILSPNNQTDTSLLKTIEELDSPIHTYEVDAPPPFTDALLTKQDVLFELSEPDDEDSIAEDDMLNMKLESKDHRKSKQDIKKYSSYRALSGALSYDVINMAPSGKCLSKEALHLKSADHLSKKTDLNKLLHNRKSLIDMENLISTKKQQKSRPTRSCNNLTNKVDEEALVMDISVVELASIKDVDSKENVDSGFRESSFNFNEPIYVQQENRSHISKSPIETLTQKPHSDGSNTLKPRSEIYDTSTLKSDAATMTDKKNTDEEPLCSPLYSFKGTDDIECPGNHIMQWLNKCDNENVTIPKDTDSDYSSSYYKTSRSSSMTELHSPTRKMSYVSDTTATNPNGKQILNQMILDPLKGCQRNINNNKNPKNPKKLHKKLSTSLNSSDISEDGYSASEEDIIDIKNQSRHKPKKRRERNRSTSLMKSNLYLKLDDQPTAHVSYV